MGDGIVLGDIVWLAVITWIASYQMSMFASKVGKSRQKFKINPPAVEGDPEFLRTFRAQQNCVEFFPIFLTILWIGGVFCHQVPASLAGLGYCYARHVYFEGYVKDAKERIPGFKLCVKFLYILSGLGLVGIGQALMLTYTGINAKQMILKNIGYGEL